jgi:parallel beta-helix repeat protein
MQAHGIYLRGSNHLVANSEVYNSTGDGIQIYSTAVSNNNNTIRNSVVHDNGNVGILLSYGINNLAYNNILYGNSKSSSSYAIYIYAGASSNQVYNNTIYSNNGFCAFIGTGSTNAVVENNICWRNTYDSVYNYGAGSAVVNNLTVNPMFVSESSKDFRLQAGSPAIDKGVAISIVSNDYLGALRPQGLAYDLGAYEYTAVGSPPALAAPTNLIISGN